ncbi:hypothetical protein M3Y95_00525000 [Aphelenchoides besseyi]|nr:hypothetical protein M3Y95_00525000 [Aphelenchoides besseyi]
MARVIVIRDDGDFQVPEAFLASRNGRIRRPISRRTVETGDPFDFVSTTSFLKRQTKKHTVPEFTSRLEDKWLHQDDTAVLKVNFNGYPEPMVWWFKDQQPVIAEMRIMIHTSENSTELAIFNAQKEDSGFYTCRIENDMGIRETNCQIYIGDTGRLLSKNGKSLAANYRTYRSALYSPSYVYSRYPSTWL